MKLDDAKSKIKVPGESDGACDIAGGAIYLRSKKRLYCVAAK